MTSLSRTFFAALRSVATAGTLASSGFYLHRRKLITADGMKAIAIISQQVATPALFFSKIIYCPQDSKQEECPNVLEHLSDVWILLLWPIFVVGSGLLVGEVAATISFTPLYHRRMVRAACGFSNSNGLPLTLLAVLNANFPATGFIRVDPSVFLSIYVLMYQILQWGVGGWLLAESRDSSSEQVIEQRGIHHVLNNIHHESVSLSEGASFEHKLVKNHECSTSHIVKDDDKPEHVRKITEPNVTYTDSDEGQSVSLIQTDSDVKESNSDKTDVSSDVAPLRVTIYNVLSEVFQPPVIGALAGLFVAAIPPLRALFVDLRDRDDDAPLEWLYDGIYVIGQAAVPLNMCILGINLSKSFQSTKGDEVVSIPTIVAVVIGKLVIMPVIGILSTLLLKKYLWTMPESVSASFYLVLMVVTITPTANNVIVMMELAGSSIKEAMARIIAWEYAVTPIILSISVMAVVRVAYT